MGRWNGQVRRRVQVQVRRFFSPSVSRHHQASFFDPFSKIKVTASQGLLQGLVAPGFVVAFEIDYRVVAFKTDDEQPWVADAHERPSPPRPSRSLTPPSTALRFKVFLHFVLFSCSSESYYSAANGPRNYE